MEKQPNKNIAAQHYLPELKTCTQEHNIFNKDRDIPKNIQHKRGSSSDGEGNESGKEGKNKTRKGLCTGRSYAKN